MSLPGKRIIQSTFDDVVRENVEDLEMEPEDAISDAIEQLTAQGIQLNNIITDLVITDDGTSWHPIVNLMSQLQSIDLTNTDLLRQLLIDIRVECDKGLAYRVLASQTDAGFSALYNVLVKLDSGELQVLALQTLCSFLNGQPDQLSGEAMSKFLEYIEHSDRLVCLYAVRLIKLSCIMHETNRQTFVSKDLIPRLARVLKVQQSEEVVQEVCQTFKSLTVDDDPRVPFSKAHDHAKMIVTEAEALELLLEVAKSHESVEVLSDIFSTLGKLAVRNEFCQRIVDLGGLELMLTVLHDNVKNRAIVTNIVGVFKAIAGNDNVKVVISKSEAPAIIVEAMDNHHMSEALCANSCACFATISLRNPHNVKRIMECNGHAAIVQCMKVHPDSTPVQKQACLAIRNLISRSRENCEPILELGAEELINRAMTVADCKDEAKGALRDLGCKVELMERWKGERGEISK